MFCNRCGLCRINFWKLQEQIKNTSYSLRCSLSTDYERWKQRVWYNRNCIHETQSGVACVSRRYCAVLLCLSSGFRCSDAFGFLNAYTSDKVTSMCIEFAYVVAYTLRSIDVLHVDNVRAHDTCKFNRTLNAPRRMHIYTHALAH